MRRAARVDGNHAELVRELRKAGIEVLDLSAVGKGCPDLLCAFRGVTVLIEVKNPARATRDPSEKVATREFIAHWPGRAAIVTTAEEAILFVIEAARPRPAWSCRVRAAGVTDPPQECNYPWCGCDPGADAVITALQEQGALTKTAFLGKASRETAGRTGEGGPSCPPT